MRVLSKTPELLPALQALDTFAAIETEALQWLIEAAEYQLYEPGDQLFSAGQRVDEMQIIVEGSFIIRAIYEGRPKEFGVFDSGHITGVLPFSRMTEAQSNGVALVPTYVLALHRSYFTEMVNQSYALTQALVALMSDRVRDFTSNRYQSEKLAALGKLSAGLAHELNNPASAMVRNAEELYKKIHATPEKFKAIMSMGISPEQTDQVNAVLFAKLNETPAAALSLMAREAAMDDVMDWLEERNLSEAEDIADTFVEFGMAAKELEQIETIVGQHALPTVLWWLESTLSLERLVGEIKEAADRIAELVRSVKDYSRMDRNAVLEAVDLHQGLSSTLTMLKHQLKDKQIQLVQDFDESLPNIEGFAGELNQVWTNLIANAVDAMEQGGQLSIRTFSERDSVGIDITDNGSGIPQDIQSRIFEPFFTTKPMGEGTGMGLDIVKKIIDRHHADIHVDSRPGKTTFKLRFPLKQQA